MNLVYPIRCPLNRLLGTRLAACFLSRQLSFKSNFRSSLIRTIVQSKSCFILYFYKLILIYRCFAFLLVLHTNFANNPRLFSTNMVLKQKAVLVGAFDVPENKDTFLLSPSANKIDEAVNGELQKNIDMYAFFVWMIVIFMFFFV